MKKPIIKTKGQSEEYDSEKVFYTAYAACLNASIEDEKAQQIAKTVVSEIDTWVGKQKDVSTQDIFKGVTKALESHDKNAAFMYATHRDIF